MYCNEINTPRHIVSYKSVIFTHQNLNNFVIAVVFFVDFAYNDVEGEFFAGLLASKF